MRKNIKSRSRSSARPVLSSVGVAVLATFMAGGSHAAGTTTINDGEGLSASVTGHATAGSPLDQSGDVGATAVGQNLGITVDGPQTGTSNVLTQNPINATAKGNSSSYSIDLSTTGSTPVDGAAILGVAGNSGKITSQASGNTVAVDLNGFADGTASNTQNSIAASTTLNQGSSSIAGVVPGSYASTTPGQTSLSFGAGADPSITHTASGSVVVTSEQQGSGAASSAAASGNSVGVNLSADANNTVSASPVLDDNTVSATLKGNSANSIANLQSGGAPTFAGSAVVTNLQANMGADVTHAAQATGNSIIATVGGNDAAVNTLQGALSVQGNAVSAAATGNAALGGTSGVAGNSIVLGDGLSFAGAGGGAQDNHSSYDHGSLSSNVAADLAVFNSQGNVGVSLSGLSSGNTIGAQVQSLDGGAVELAGNGITSAATGNAASSAIASGANAASFTGAAAVGNQQINYNGGVQASTAASTIGATVAADNGTTHQSTVDVSGNASGATAYGNSGSQSLALSATQLALGGGVLLQGGGVPDGNVSASGVATVTNLQGNYSAAVSATNAGSTVGLSADSGGASPNVMVGNTLSVGSNTQEAVALGNSAGNSLTLSGGSVGTGAGISSAQIVDGNSPVEAQLTGSTASLYAGTHVQDSSLALTNNLQRAIGYGNSASNALGVTANGIDAIGIIGVASTVAPGAPEDNLVHAGYGVLNTQSVQSNVSATATGPTGNPDITAINTLVEGKVSGSSVTTAKNAFVAAAYGNDASSAATLALGTGASAIGGGAIANVTNVQDVAGAATAVTATANGGNVVRTSIEDAVTGSTVSTSGNQVQALAYGSRASNSLSVTGNALDTASILPPIGGGAIVGVAGATTDAAFSVQNVQTGAGTVTATQRGETTGAAQIRSQVGGDVANSTLTADDNSSSASATSNKATNTLGLSGNSLSTTSALQNVQSTSASVHALVGTAGSPGSSGTPDAPFSFDIQVVAGSGFGGTASDGSVTITAGTVYVNESDLTPTQIATLTGSGWTVGSGANAGRLIHSADILGTVDSTVYTALTGGLATAFSATVPGTPASAAVASQGGVTLAVAGSTSGSKLSVSGNSNTASVTGNSASNTSTIAGNDVGQSSLRLTATAGDQTLGLAIGAEADHALSNVQAVTGSQALGTSIYGSFAIDAAAPGASIVGSTLAVSNNAQVGTAVANTAVNHLAVSGTNLSTTTALASLQSGDAVVSAMSNMGVSAPGAVSNSSVDMSGNSNTALGVINDATNTLTVSATNVTPVGAVVNTLVTPTSVTGDHVLSNQQQAKTSVSSVATTQLYNEEQVSTATSGLANSAVTVTGNSTMAEASANRADNAVALNGASLQSANAGLSNAQSSSAAVTASATTTTNFALNSISPTAALNQSGVTIDGNSTTALARGNAATNTLDISAGSSYGVSTAGTAGSSLGASGLTQATAGLMNAQANDGAVSANSTGAAYQVALNAPAGLTPGVTNGTVAVTSNQVLAQAFGNSATNAVTVAALNTGTPSTAVGNYQVNRGNITATATAVNYGVGITGGASGSSLRVGGNQVNATAVGNSVVSSIAAR